MGKLNIKQKAKLAAAKRRTQDTNNDPSASVSNPFELRPTQPTPTAIPTVEDFDDKSVISFKALHGVTKNKKEKLKLRRKLWHEKIEACKDKARKDKKKNGTPSPGKSKTLETKDGFRLLLDSLPFVKVDKDFKAKVAVGDADATSSKAPKRKSEKRRVKEDLRNIETMHQVLRHPEFRKNPMDTMLEHLKNKIQMEKDGDTFEEDDRPVAKKKSRNRLRREARKAAKEMNMD